MIRRDGDRAVTVQIGAVLLLAIVFSALALYQVNVVPAENRAVEIDHNRQVHDGMRDLRNAVRNAGAGGGPASVSVPVGTRYPPRTFLVNPPDPAGTLETTDNGTISVANAAVTGQYDGDSDPSGLIGDHETTGLRYRPDYNEYGDAPTTRIEHGFAYNDFGGTAVPLTGQPLVDGDRITIVLLEGNLTASSAGATTVDARVVDGPTDPVTIRPDGGDITITVPTAAPDAWNESLAAESNATVTGFDDGELTITLADGEYDLRMARVGVGDASEPATERFDVRRSTGTDDGPPYAVDWRDPSGQNGVDDASCDSDSCLVTDDPIDLSIRTADAVADASVDYAVSDRGVGRVSPSDGTTAADGTHAMEFSVGPDADAGDTVTVYASSGGDGDTIDLEIDGSAVAPEPVAFTTDSGGELRTATDDDGVSAFGNDVTADAIGPMTSEFDGDSDDDVPYVDGNRLYVTDRAGPAQELVSPAGRDGVNPASAQTLLAVGSWETDATSIYFADNNRETIYRVDESASQTEVTTPDNGVSAVVGVADVAGDRQAELLYVDGSQVLRYLSSSDDRAGTALVDVGENNGIGVGRPADFTGDGEKRVPVIDGNSHLQLVAGDGTTETVSTDPALTKSPVAPVDWDGDGKLEVVFVADTTELAYVDDVDGSPTVRTARPTAASTDAGAT